MQCLSCAACGSQAVAHTELGRTPQAMLVMTLLVRLSSNPAAAQILLSLNIASPVLTLATEIAALPEHRQTPQSNSGMSSTSTDTIVPAEWALNAADSGSEAISRDQRYSMASHTPTVAVSSSLVALTHPFVIRFQAFDAFIIYCGRHKASVHAISSCSHRSVLTTRSLVLNVMLVKQLHPA